MIREKSSLMFALFLIINHMKNTDFNNLVLSPIAHIKTDFPTKFGIPRQGDIVSSLKGKIIFEKKFRKEGILRGIDDFSHLWLIWGFSAMKKGTDFSPTIRPPKLGGNTRIGVFASRSPNRPNPLGLSCVKIEKIINGEEESPIIIVSGVDLMDNTPIYDIKPYIPYCDRIENARGGFSEKVREKPLLSVEIPDEIREKVPKEKLKLLIEILSNDPRPGFQHDPDRIYGFSFSGMEIKFKVSEEKNLHVISIENQKDTLSF